MEKYLLDSRQLETILDKTIDLFLKYQYSNGYEEPLARSRAVADVIGSLRVLKAGALNSDS